MWHFPQLSGCRACAAEKLWRLWQAVQEPSEPSGLMRPMPVLGQVAGSRVPSFRTFTCEPWHCQHPLTAAAETPSGKAGVTNALFPSTTSASTLSREPRMRPAFAWCEATNSFTSCAWQRAQSSGLTMTEIIMPWCS